MDSASSASPDGNNGADLHPLDSLIARLSQGEDYFHPAIRVAWEIGQNPISLKDAMLHRQTLSQLIEAAEKEERDVRSLVDALSQAVIIHHRH